jgi:hypothetical protein
MYLYREDRYTVIHDYRGIRRLKGLGDTNGRDDLPIVVRAI